MKPPFTTEQFFEVMALYNEAMWPMQLVLNLLAIVAIGLLIWHRTYSDRLIAAILGLLWVWTGTAYHLMYFTTINTAAFAFGAICFAGASAFLWTGVIRGQMAFAPTTALRSVLGVVLVAFSLVIYPILSSLLGHSYPAMPTFGLPCPTTIFTVGMLCFLSKPYPRYILAAPILWSIIGAQAAFLFGVYQDLGLLAAGIVGIYLIVRSK